MSVADRTLASTEKTYYGLSRAESSSMSRDANDPELKDQRKITAYHGLVKSNRSSAEADMACQMVVVWQLA
jgi:hypothetical protein